MWEKSILFSIIFSFSLLAEANMSSGFKLPYTSAYGTQLSPSVVRHIWSDHSLPVTDIWCGFGGLQCRVATVSMDQTCKVNNTQIIIFLFCIL